MSHHNGQTSTTSDTFSGSSQFSTQRQENNQLIDEIKLFDINQFQDVELNIILNTSNQLQTHYFGKEPQPPLRKGVASCSYSFPLLSHRGLL